MFFLWQACDAWKKEATEAGEKAKLADKDKQAAVLFKEEVIPVDSNSLLLSSLMISPRIKVPEGHSNF